MEDMTDLAGNVALVTGASRGIGRAVALALATEGVHVVATSRTIGALEELDDEIRNIGGTSTLIPLDLADADKVDALGPTLFARWGRLDLLIANAGILGPLSPLGHLSNKDWSRVIDINLTANWRLIRCLDPVMRRSDRGRALFVGSAAASHAKAYWGAYSVSKAGLDVLAKTYAAETVNNTNIVISLLEPGAVATAMRAKAFPGEDPATLPKPGEIASFIIAHLKRNDVTSGKTVSYSR